MKGWGGGRVWFTRSIAPRTRWYRTPGQSWLRPPRTRTTLCCWTLWPGWGREKRGKSLARSSYIGDLIVGYAFCQISLRVFLGKEEEGGGGVIWRKLSQSLPNPISNESPYFPCFPPPPPTSNLLPSRLQPNPPPIPS